MLVPPGVHKGPSDFAPIYLQSMLRRLTLLNIPVHPRAARIAIDDDNIGPTRVDSLAQELLHLAPVLLGIVAAERGNGLYKGYIYPLPLLAIVVCH